MGLWSVLSALPFVGAALIPPVFLLGGLFAPLAAPRLAGLAFALAGAVAVAFSAGGGSVSGPSWVRVDVLTVVMMLLVTGLGAVVVRYAATAVRGERRADALGRWLLLTLGAVSTLILAGHLLLLAAAWTATGFALHQLLTHESERPMALLAAHKKFLLSRVADLAMGTALLLIHLDLGGLELARLEAWSKRGVAPDLSLQVAAVLIVVTVALRTAQVPFHGWLTQVMEAPTPVSALLHAGVVNIGGFVLIRLAPFMASMTMAQLLLVAIGLVSMVVGSLVALTRVSVKVALAWSTCAQMGFMLVQCGLGAWPLALLHLVAHSLYKAHAFLSAGSTVERWRTRSLHSPTGAGWRRIVGSAAGLGAAGLIVSAALEEAGVLVVGPSVWGPGVVVCLSLTPLVGTPRAAGPVTFAVGVGHALLVAVAVVITHALAAALLPTPPAAPLVSAIGWTVVVLAALVVFWLKTVLTQAPRSRLACWLWPWLFAGLHLDERVTRLTFRLWPPRLPPPPMRSAVPSLQATTAQVSA